MNNLEDIGIYQDGDKSIEVDSVPVEDFSLNISTDDEHNVFENSDVTFDEDDISLAGQSIPDIGSLTEFEEVEKKIRRNRVTDDDSSGGDNTDDNTDISDIPTDMENKYRKGSQTASSATSSRQPSFEQNNKPTTITIQQQQQNNNTITRRPSSSVSPPPPVITTIDRNKLGGKQLQDTGYQSTVGSGSPINKVQPQQQRRRSSQISTFRDQLSSPNDGLRSNTSSNDLTAVSTDIPLSTDIHPVTDKQMNESGEPNSMVATFGTTEDFERLLKQQLVDDESNNDGEQFEPFHLQSDSSSDEKEKTKENSPPPKSISKPTPKERSSKLPVKSERLSSTLPSSRNKSPPRKPPLRKPSKPKTNPATRKSSLKGGKSADNKNHVRSPAANRARNARNMRSAISPLTRESSGDDLSVRSDASSSELKYRLRNERKSGKEQAELLKHLQENYSDLLMKFADAENTIDKLRLGAKIDLAVTLPHASEDLSLPTHQATVRRTDSNISATTISSDRTNRSSRPSSATTSSLLRHTQSNPQLSSTPVPPVPAVPAETLESSLKLPMSAKSELYKIGLRYQAKDLQNKIDSLATLLHETDLPRDERESAMRNVEDAMTSLEDDYDAAVGKHEDEKHKLSLIHGVEKVEREIPEFDQGGNMDKEIKSLGDMVKALRDTISRINAQEDAWNNEKKKRIQPNNHQIPNNKKKELEEKFQQLLDKHNKSNEDDGHTTATSIPYQEDDVIIRSERAIPNIYMAPADSFNDDSMFTTSQTSQSTIKSSPYSARKMPTRTSSVNSSFTSVTSATPSTTKHPMTSSVAKPIAVKSSSTSPSRIPRLIQSNTKKKLIVTNAPPQQGDKGTDSGFVGSESSRQSIASPMTSSRTRKPDVTVTSSKQASSVTSSKQRNSRPTEKRRTRKPETTMMTMKKQPISNNNNKNERIIRQKPQKDDVSTTGDDVSTTSTIRHHDDEVVDDGLIQTSASDASTVRRNNLPLDGQTAPPVDDSALQKIRGEIERLRDEIKKQQQNKEEEEEKERQKKKEKEEKERMEQEEKEKREKEKREKEEREREEREREEREKEEREKRENEEKKKNADEMFRPLRVSTPVNNESSASTSDNETLQIIKDDIKALKNEMRRQSRPGRQSRRRLSLASDSDTASSCATSVIYRGHRRSRSLTRGESQLNFPQTAPQIPVGYWTYVPDAPVWTTSPIGRRYIPKIMTSPTMTSQPQQKSPLLITTQPSKPNLSVFISPRGGAPTFDGDVIKKADVYIVDPSFRNNQQQIHRSSSMSRLNHNDDVIIDSPLMTSRLNTSLDRAVRSAQLLRDKTRRIYTNVRDDVTRSHLFADTF